MEIRKQSAGRKQLVDLFTDKVGVEVGTERGKYANLIAQVANKLSVVDLWKNYGNYRKHVTDEYYEEILADAHARLDKYGVEFIRDDSVKAAERFEDASLDFVYLDANHKEEFVYNDAQAWWPKLRPGGILAGHDWEGHHPDVKKAITRFCLDNGVKEITIWTGDRSASFHIVK